jgi:hypothetical protein
MEQQELFETSVVIEEPKLLALDPQVFEIDLNVGSEAKPKIASARLRAPLAEEDFEYAKQTSTEYRDAGNEENEIVVDDERASVNLFDKCVTHVKGFVLRGEDKSLGEEWRDAEPIKQHIHSTWKAAFVRGMRIASAKFVEDEGDFVVLGGGDVIEVDFIVGHENNPIGAAKFFIPEPEESERVKFGDQSIKFLQGRGRKKSSRIVTNLKACVDFFDLLMDRPGAMIEGGTVGGKTFDKCESPISKKIFLAGINPVYKARIINAAMAKYNARLQD